MEKKVVSKKSGTSKKGKKKPVKKAIKKVAPKKVSPKKAGKKKAAKKKAAPRKAAVKKVAPKKAMPEKAKGAAPNKTGSTKAAEFVSSTDSEADLNGFVPFTYVLTKTSDIILEKVRIGYTTIDLSADMDPSDPNKYAPANASDYKATLTNEGLKVFVQATGKEGDDWNLEITLDGSALADNPIKKEADANGNANHNEFHN